MDVSESGFKMDVEAYHKRVQELLDLRGRDRDAVVDIFPMLYLGTRWVPGDDNATMLQVVDLFRCSVTLGVVAVPLGMMPATEARSRYTQAWSKD